jgi:hypothetical protein
MRDARVQFSLDDLFELFKGEDVELKGIGTGAIMNENLQFPYIFMLLRYQEIVGVVSGL